MTRFVFNTAATLDGYLADPDHSLAWLFEVADRPEGWWARSHLVGGQRKDQAFQLDQQLYPLLELLDYREAAGASRIPRGGRGRWSGGPWPATGGCRSPR